MPANNFEIEVTERTVMNSANETVSKLVRLKQLGFKISIDDFGTGYSSLSYLVRFPLDCLKIDRSPRLLVMGDMGETGHQAADFHREVGAHARQRGIEQIWTVGRDMQAAADAAGDAARHWPDADALLAAHAQLPAGVASVLVKGSRFMRMERIVDAWAGSPVPARAGEH